MRINEIGTGRLGDRMVDFDIWWLCWAILNIKPMHFVVVFYKNIDGSVGPRSQVQ